MSRFSHGIAPSVLVFLLALPLIESQAFVPQVVTANARGLQIRCAETPSSVRIRPRPLLPDPDFASACETSPRFHGSSPRRVCLTASSRPIAPPRVRPTPMSSCVDQPASCQLPMRPNVIGAPPKLSVAGDSPEIPIAKGEGTSPCLRVRAASNA